LVLPLLLLGLASCLANKTDDNNKNVNARERTSAIAEFWYVPESYPRNYRHRNHYKTHFNVMLEPNSRISFESHKELYAVVACYGIRPIQTYIIDRDTTAYYETQDEPCIPFILNRETSISDSNDRTSSSVTITLLSGSWSQLNYYNEDTSYNDFQARVRWWNNLNSQISLYETSHAQMLFTPGDGNYYKNIEQLQTHTNKITEIIKYYECLSNKDTCFGGKYKNISNRKLFYKPECVKSDISYNYNKTCVIYAPMNITKTVIRNLDRNFTEKPIAIGLDSIVYDTFETINMNNKRKTYTTDTKSELCNSGWYGYSGEHHLAVRSTMFNEWVTEWVTLHETGHVYDLYTVDSFWSNQEVHVNIWATSYESRFTKDHYWLNCHNREEIIESYKNRQMNLSDLCSALNFIYSMLSFAPNLFKNYQKDASNDRQQETNFLASVVITTHNITGYNIYPAVVQAMSVEKEEWFMDFLDLYTIEDSNDILMLVLCLKKTNGIMSLKP